MYFLVNVHYNGMALKQAIVDEVAAIDEDLRRRVYGNLQTFLQQCNATEAICLM
jgi:hypothetical protein